VVWQGECLRQHSGETFQRLWQPISFWQCYFWVSDGNPVYPIFIPDGDQIVSKSYRTRVEGENTRLRHYNRASSSSDSRLFKMCQNVRKFPTASSSLP
jgi:IS1 family transposase